MAEDITKLLLEELLVIRADVAAGREDVREIKNRVIAIEADIVKMKRST